MLILPEHEKKLYKGYLIILIIAGLCYFIFKIDILQAVGVGFVLYVGFTVFMELAGLAFSKIIFKEVFPKSIKELKHSNTQYQYVLRLPTRELYSYVYNKPLNTVKIRCFVFNGLYVLEVTSRGDKDEKKKI